MWPGAAITVCLVGVWGPWNVSDGRGGGGATEVVFGCFVERSLFLTFSILLNLFIGREDIGYGTRVSVVPRTLK